MSAREKNSVLFSEELELSDLFTMVANGVQCLYELHLRKLLHERLCCLMFQTLFFYSSEKVLLCVKLALRQCTEPGASEAFLM